MGVWAISILFRGLFVELTLAPLLSLLSLFYLASRREPWFVFFWIFPFAILSFYLIIPFSQYAWVRSLTLVLGGLITVYVSYLRARAEALANSHHLILSKLPYPILVSDATSKIVYFNDTACSLLKIQAKELFGFSWFNLLWDAGNKSDDIEKYVRLSLSQEKGRKEVFRLCGMDGRLWTAEVLKDSLGQGGRLITTITPATR